MELNTEQKMSKKTGRFITWWVAIWYNLLYIIFFASWYLYSTQIAIAMPKANGEPFEDVGMFLGIMPAFITTIGIYAVCKKYIFDTVRRLEQTK